MPTHAEQRLLPYTPEQLFALVADVERYPEFLPWCVGARVRERRPGRQTRTLGTAGLWPAARDAGAPGLLRREGRLLFSDQALDHAAHVHAVGVRRDIDEPVLAELTEPRLLRLDHLAVLDKGRRDLPVELLGRFRLV